MTHDEGDQEITPEQEVDAGDADYPTADLDDTETDYSETDDTETDDTETDDTEWEGAGELDQVDTDVAGTHSKISKVRAERPLEGDALLEAGNRRMIILAIGAILVISVLAAFFVSRSAENKDLRLVDGSVEEQLTADCFWTIVFELENTSGETLVALDTSVFTGQGNLSVTRAALDIVIEPGQQVQNGIQYFVQDCPGTAAEIEHGSLEVTNATLGGRQQTTRLDF